MSTALFNNFSLIRKEAKIIQNGIIKSVEVGAGYLGLPDKAKEDKPWYTIDGIKNKLNKENITWYTNYASLTSAIVGFKEIVKSFIPNPSLPFVEGHYLGGIVVAVLQGYDKCRNQERLNKFPIAAAITGFINGTICCFGMSYIAEYSKNYLSPFIGNEEAEKVGKIVSYAAHTFVADRIMCKIEGGVATALELYYGVPNAAVTNAGEINYRETVTQQQQAKACCCAVRR